MEWKDLNINVRGKTSGQVKTLCPKCSRERKKANDPCLSVNIDEQIWNCKHCGWAGSLRTKEGTNKVYAQPQLNNTELSEKSFGFLKERGISTTTIKRNKLTESHEFFPTEQKSGVAICFNYFRDKELVNVKYRGPTKAFKLFKGAELTFYKLDDIKDKKEIIITEGEIDALSFEEAGMLNAVSVPNGASKGNNNMQYFDNCYEYFKDIDKVYLATDGDEAGETLRDELARRVGKEYCYIVRYPEECKDANEVLLKHGKEAVAKLLHEAKPYPIEGVILTDEVREDITRLYDKGFDGGATINYTDFDKLCSFKTSMLYIITGAPTHGKAKSIETDIPTVDGWKKMKDIKVGDRVFDEQGNLCNVTKVTDIMYGRPCYELTLSNNVKIICDEEHQWVTDTWKSRRSASNAKRNDRDSERPLKLRGIDQTHKRSFSKTRTTKEIFNTLKAKTDGRNNHSIDVSDPIDLPHKYLEIHPYLLGVWLGDGHSSSSTVTSCEKPIREHIASLGYTLGKRKDPGKFSVLNIMYKFRKYNLINNKHIPEIYLRASTSQRMELLKGLMDTDGTIDTRGQCEYCSVRKGLAEDVYELVCSLGMRASFQEGIAKLYGRVTGPRYRIQFTPNKDVFRLKRHLERIQIKSIDKISRRYVVDCKKVKSVPVKCIEVDSPSHQYLCTKSFVPTHNSSFLNQIEIKLAVRHGWKFGVFSPEHYPLAYLVYRYLEMYIGKPFFKGPNERMSAAEVKLGMNFINDHFYFVRPKNDMFTLDEILNTAKSLVLRYGIKGFTMDPWSMVEHDFNSFNEHQYIERALNKITLFKQINDLCIFLVAHTRKMQKVRDNKSDYYGLHEIPTLYDIAGSSNFYNKADFGITVYRNFNTKMIEVYVQKSKYKHLGDIGLANFHYDKVTSRFYPEGGKKDMTREGGDLEVQEDLPFTDLKVVHDD